MKKLLPALAFLAISLSACDGSGTSQQSSDDGKIYLRCKYRDILEAADYKLDQSDSKSPKIFAYDPSENQYLDARYLWPGNEYSQASWMDVKEVYVDNDAIKIAYEVMTIRYFAKINRSTGSLSEISPDGTSTTIGTCEKSQNMISGSKF